MQLNNPYQLSSPCPLPPPHQETSYILPCDLEKATGDKKTVALETLERLRGLLQKLPYENYVTLARLLFHLAR